MPVELNFNERRVLGVLIEKAFVTPEQYPLSLNGVVVGSNQKSCREPMSYIDENQAQKTLESLQAKGFVVCVRMIGSRVDKWKHKLSEACPMDGKEMAVLAELLLRGPQTDGELRQRSSRMREIGTLEDAERILETLQSRPDPLVERLGPPGRRRGVKFAHRFYPAAERPTEDSVGGDGWESESGVEAAPRSAPVVESREPVRVPSAAPLAGAGSLPGVTAGQPAQPAVAPGVLDDLRTELQRLKERVQELEDTFVKFLK
jgi:uncharacterized protein YceH (UPF0502 family)